MSGASQNHKEKYVLTYMWMLTTGSMITKLQFIETQSVDTE